MKGFSLIEVVVYVAILSALTVIAVGILLSVNTYLTAIRVTRTLSDTEALAMERIIRIIRDSSAINAGSVFDSSPGILSLNGPEATPVIRVLSLGGGTLAVVEGGNPPEALTPPGVAVTSLIFRSITASTTSKAVKVEMTLAASSGRATTTQKIYGTAVLRNSYGQ